MAMNIFDYVRCKKEYDGRYSITKHRVLCMVIGFKGDCIRVIPIAVGTDGLSSGQVTELESFHVARDYIRSRNSDEGYLVDANRFEKIEKEDFIKEYNNYDILDEADIKTLESMSKIKDVMVPEETEHILPTPEELESMYLNIDPFFKRYGYTTNEDFVKGIMSDSIYNKSALINMLSKHPNWIPEKKMIVQKAIIESGIDFEVVKSFCFWADSQLFEIVKRHEVIIEGVKYDTLKRMSIDLSGNDRLFSRYKRETKNSEMIAMLQHLEDESYLLQDKISTILSLYKTKTRIYKDLAIEPEYYKIYTSAKEIFKQLYDLCTSKQADVRPYVNDNLAKIFNNIMPELEVKVGQKLTRVIAKLCKITGLDKIDGYYYKSDNYEYQRAAIGDALNPIEKERWCIISVNPVDFWLMSHGAKWSSCHTIDKQGLDHQNGDEDHYNGCNSSGTESYMLDETSFMFYVVSEKYEGKDFEIQPKIMRRMLHWNNGLLLHSRVYPKANTDNTILYKSIFDFVNQTIDVCNDCSGQWVEYKKRRKDIIDSKIKTNGTHYPDYYHFPESMQVSYYLRDKDIDAKKMKPAIQSNLPTLEIGANPVCPCCGLEHYNQENILCRDCISNGGYASYEEG